MDERARTEGNDPPADARELFASYLVRRGEGERLDLEDLCREHPEHAAALRGLHSDQERLERWLARPSGDPSEPEAGGAAERVGAPEASGGERLRLLGEVARGGMGRILSVWDGELRRKLAMKVAVGAGERGPSPRELSRFLQEAQITAQLDHPGIVPVHELGVGRDGRAYFTMKLVRGRHLGAAFALARAGREGWSLSRAVGVLVRVCETVAFAHSRGVVHRDLKPENVMVGDYGEAYVMDWGLARVHAEREPDAAVESPAAEVTTDREELAAATPRSPLLTGEGGVVGTPAYLAPEQAEGRTELVGPLADVYSLGAMLYALLAGHAPYLEPGAELAPRALLARVRASPPRALAEIAPDAPAEIVAVCEKAMARDPARRYAGALELGEDLRSWLEGRVVRAHRTGAWAELHKWVGRNRAFASAAAALALVTVLGSLGFALQQSSSAHEQARLNGELSKSRDAALAESARADAEADRARDEAERARVESRTASEVVEFLAGMFEQQDPAAARGREVTVAEVVERAAQRLETELRDEPEVRGDLLFVLGRVYRTVNRLEQAEAMLDESLALRAERSGPDDPRVLEVSSELGLLSVDRGQPARAEERFRDLLERYRRVYGSDHEFALGALNNLAVAVRRQDRLGEALPLLEQVAEGLTTRLGDENPQAIGARNNLGSALSDAGQLTRAEELFREARDATVRRLGADHPSAIVYASNLGRALRGLGRHEEAEAELRNALERAERVFGEDHVDTGTVLYQLGVLYSAMRRLPEAEAMLQRAMAVLQNHSDPLDPRRGACSQGLAIVRAWAGDHAGAAKYAHDALEVAVANHGELHPAVLGGRTFLARELAVLERDAEAEQAFRLAHESWREVAGDGDRRTLAAEFDLASFYASRRRWDEAEPLARDVVERTAAGDPARAAREELLRAIDDAQAAPGAPVTPVAPVTPGGG